MHGLAGSRHGGAWRRPSLAVVMEDGGLDGREEGESLGKAGPGEDFMVGKKTRSRKEHRTEGERARSSFRGGPRAFRSGAGKGKGKEESSRRVSPQFPPSLASRLQLAGLPRTVRSGAPPSKRQRSQVAAGTYIHRCTLGHASRVQQRRTSWLVVAFAGTGGVTDSWLESAFRRVGGDGLDFRLPARHPSGEQLPRARSLPMEANALPTRRRCSRCGRWLGMARLSAAAGRNFQARALDQSAV